MIVMQKNHIHITVDVEEWFHSNWFDVPDVIERYYKGKYPKTDVVKTTKELVDTFDSYGVETTFFVLGETATKYPAIIEILSDSQHEIACHGWYHNKIYDDLTEFKKDVLRFKKDICPFSQGFRFPNFGYSNEKFKFLSEEGFKYDSSIVPCLNIPGWYGNFKSPLKPYNLNLGDGRFIMEFPMSVLPYLRLPGAGGWFLRNISYQWSKTVLKFSLKKNGYGMIYVHPWEISKSNPHIKEIPFHVFRNTGQKLFKNLKNLIETFSENEFVNISSEL
jgi:peptidoglycan/xylan/chitin deacetylase (PgdA/CDA1 family)